MVYPLRTVLVPNYVSDAINHRLDTAIAETAEAANDREYLFNCLLDYFDEHGTLPEFSLQKIQES